MAVLGTSSVSLEVVPANADQLAALIAGLRKTAEDHPTGFTAFLREAPALHFMSLSVTRSAELDPLLVIEVNYDLPAGAFWLQLDAAIGEPLRAMLRLTKRPRDADAGLYDAVTEPGTRLSVAAYLERRASTPSVYHHGNRGMVRARIVAEYELFRATRTAIAAHEAEWRPLPPPTLHKALRAALLPGFAWLDQEVPPRIPWREHLGDFLRFAAGAVVVLLVLSLPGFIAARLATARWFVGLSAVLAAGIGFALYRLRAPAAGTATGDGTSLVSVLLGHWRPLVLALAIYLVAVGAAGAVSIALFGDVPWRRALAMTARPLLLSLLATLVVVLPGLVLWLRRLELRDSAQEAPAVDDAALAAMARREDWLSQNHMISIVLLKPGVLRTALVHAGHWLLNLWLRLAILDGYLGSMRTIHFAHWAFINNGARLMFHSNYDLSWEAYLDDFIEKAHEGLTLAWGSGLGFPPTRMLVGDGASRGRLFKAWARQSMSETGFWYCAYPGLTVDQVERNFRVASGLRAKHLPAAAAAQWMNDL